MSNTKTTKFTDAHRQPVGGYVDSLNTNIRATFNRVRAEIPHPGEDPLDPTTWIELQPEREPALKHR